MVVEEDSTVVVFFFFNPTYIPILSICWF